MDLYALAAVIVAVGLLFVAIEWGLSSAFDRGRDGERRAAEGAALAHAAELREEQLRAGRAEALAEERRLRLVALATQGRAWAAGAAADAATLAALDAHLAAPPGAPLDVDRAVDGLLRSARAAGAGDADRGASPPASAGPPPAAPA